MLCLGQHLSLCLARMASRSYSARGLTTRVSGPGEGGFEPGAVLQRAWDPEPSLSSLATSSADVFIIVSLVLSPCYSASALGPVDSRIGHSHSGHCLHRVPPVILLHTAFSVNILPPSPVFSSPLLSQNLTVEREFSGFTEAVCGDFRSTAVRAISGVCGFHSGSCVTLPPQSSVWSRDDGLHVSSYTAPNG